MIHTELEQPADVMVSCKICGKPLGAHFHWVFNRWLRPTVHNKCAEAFDRGELGPHKPAPAARPVPERFAHFEPSMANGDAHAACAAFSPDYQYHCLALIGERAKGKSRLMFAVVEAYFDQLKASTGADRWCDYWTFSDLMTNPDRSIWTQIREARYVFLDDIGATKNTSRAATQLEDTIRFRVQAGKWSFLTIDDPVTWALEDLFRDRALAVYVA